MHVEEPRKDVNPLNFINRRSFPHYTLHPMKAALPVG